VLQINKIDTTIKCKNENQSNRLHLTEEEKNFLHSPLVHSVEMSYVRNLFDQLIKVVQLVFYYLHG
jgi:hypothetical protein